MRRVSNMNLRGRSSSYCFLNEAAAIVLEHKLATSRKTVTEIIPSGAARHRMAGALGRVA